MSGIGIITNPHSKSNKRNPNRSKLLNYIVGKEGFMESTDTLEDLKNAAQYFFDNNIRYLAINGGDGTISHTISSFIDIYKDRPLPHILLLGGGTMNVLARNLGLRGSTEKRLIQLVEQTSTGELPTHTSLQSIEIDGMHGFLYADGTSNHLLEEFYRFKTGTLGGAWLGIRTCLSALWRGPFFRKLIRSRFITYQARPHVAFPHNTLGTFATTLAFLPLGLPMFGRKLRADGQFRATTIQLKPENLLFRLPLLAFFSKQGYYLGKHNFDTKELRIEGLEDFRYTLDGEIYTSIHNGVTIKAGKVIKFIIPT